MRRSLLAVSLVLCAAPLFAQEAPHAQQTAASAKSSNAHVLTRAELDKLLADPKGLLLIDVRRPDEVSKIGGLPIYLNVQIDDLQNKLQWIPRERTIVTVSNHAKRAATAADLLASKGFKVAGAVGVQTYEEQGGKLTKVAIPSRADTPPAASNAGVTSTTTQTRTTTLKAGTAPKATVADDKQW